MFIPFQRLLGNEESKANNKSNSYQHSHNVSEIKFSLENNHKNKNNTKQIENNFRSNNIQEKSSSKHNKFDSFSENNPQIPIQLKLKYFESPISNSQIQYEFSAPVARSTPENNKVRQINYRHNNIAAFNVDGKELICLPQAFEVFLKNFVGGLHTVYTKLKRLDIIPIVCNVEQVRILRGLGAIQAGVNRCKLIAPSEFDILFEDCTNSGSRPGRPPKRNNNDSDQCNDICNSSEKSKSSSLSPPFSIASSASSSFSNISQTSDLSNLNSLKLETGNNLLAKSNTQQQFFNSIDYLPNIKPYTVTKSIYSLANNEPFCSKNMETTSLNPTINNENNNSSFYSSTAAAFTLYESIFNRSSEETIQKKNPFTMLMLNLNQANINSKYFPSLMQKSDDFNNNVSTIKSNANIENSKFLENNIKFHSLSENTPSECSSNQTNTGKSMPALEVTNNNELNTKLIKSTRKNIEKNKKIFNKIQDVSSDRKYKAKKENDNLINKKKIAINSSGILHTNNNKIRINPALSVEYLVGKDKFNENCKIENMQNVQWSYDEFNFSHLSTNEKFQNNFIQSSEKITNQDSPINICTLIDIIKENITSIEKKFKNDNEILRQNLKIEKALRSKFDSKIKNLVRLQSKFLKLFFSENMY